MFCTTSVKNLEAELSYALVSEFTDEGAEWLDSSSFQEHKTKLAATKKRIWRNWLKQRIGLGLIVLGFGLQLIGILI